jgi:hypothetical protein
LGGHGWNEEQDVKKRVNIVYIHYKF